MKISWVILTFNRSKIVQECFNYNFKNSGRKIDEIIWVDNGSSESISIDADVSIRNKTNLGVAKGYNRGIVLATGSHIAITGCDRKMPVGWASTFEKYFNQISNTGLISCYSKPIEKVNERKRANCISVNGLEIIPSMPMEAKCFPRALLKESGHLREDFGLYGHEDLEWGHRVERVCEDSGLLTYTIPNFVSQHFGSEGSENFNGVDSREYHEFKQNESRAPEKERLMSWCRERNWPYYTPYV